MQHLLSLPPSSPSNTIGAGGAAAAGAAGAGEAFSMAASMALASATGSAFDASSSLSSQSSASAAGGFPLRVWGDGEDDPAEYDEWGLDEGGLDADGFDPGADRPGSDSVPLARPFVIIALPLSFSLSFSPAGRPLRGQPSFAGSPSIPRASTGPAGSPRGTSPRLRFGQRRRRRHLPADAPPGQ